VRHRFELVNEKGSTSCREKKGGEEEDEEERGAGGKLKRKSVASPHDDMPPKEKHFEACSWC